MDVDTGNRFPTLASSTKRCKESFVTAARKSSRFRSEAEGSRKGNAKVACECGIGAALTQPWLSARALGSFSRGQA